MRRCFTRCRPRSSPCCHCRGCVHYGATCCELLSAVAPQVACLSPWLPLPRLVWLRARPRVASCPQSCCLIAGQLSDCGMVFYGWVVLCAASLLIFSSGPGHTFGVNAFVDHFIEDLHISRSSVSTVWAVALVVSSVLIPVVGQLLDTIGVRYVVLVACVGFVGALFLMSMAQSAVTLTIAISMLRFFGPECMVLSANTTINRWFVRRRGFAFSVSGMLSNVMLAYPAFCAALIQKTGGWRTAYRVLAVGVCCLCVCVRHSLHCNYNAFAV